MQNTAALMRGYNEVLTRLGVQATREMGTVLVQALSGMPLCRYDRECFERVSVEENAFILDGCPCSGLLGIMFYACRSIQALPFMQIPSAIC